MGTLRSVARAAACILVPVISGAAVGFLTMNGTWYATLNKPWFTPPGYVFGPVWTVLYILMGISLYLVISHGWEEKNVRYGVLLFGLQLVANLAWSFLFFGLQSPLIALVDIVILWFLIAATMVFFYKVQKSAAYLLIPYIAWVSIATALNAAIYFLNP